MPQPRIHQRSQTSHTFVYTVVRNYNGVEYMLKGVDPRIWTTNPNEALIFGGKIEAKTCIVLFVDQELHSEVSIERMRISG